MHCVADVGAAETEPQPLHARREYTVRCESTYMPHNPGLRDQRNNPCRRPAASAPLRTQLQRRHEGREATPPLRRCRVQGRPAPARTGVTKAARAAGQRIAAERHEVTATRPIAVGTKTPQQHLAPQRTRGVALDQSTCFAGHPLVNASHCHVLASLWPPGTTEHLEPASTALASCTLTSEPFIEIRLGPSSIKRAARAGSARHRETTMPAANTARAVTTFPARLQAPWQAERDQQRVPSRRAEARAAAPVVGRSRVLGRGPGMRSHQAGQHERPGASRGKQQHVGLAGRCSSAKAARPSVVNLVRFHVEDGTCPATQAPNRRRPAAPSIEVEATTTANCPAGPDQ
jgi:hypothetical protein